MTTKVDGTNGVLQSYDYQVMTTGFSYTFAAGITNLIMNPAGTLATGTITMPASPADGMTITFSSTQTITALTVNGNSGQTVVGAPTTLTAGAVVVLVYRLSATTWITQVNTNSSGATGVPVLTAYTSPGTWTKPATIKAIKVTVVGGGGGGGSGFSNVGGGGGGGGGSSVRIYPAPSLPGPQPYTVGAAGPAPPYGGSGSGGGTSSFGVAPVTVISATGGSTGANAGPGVGGNGAAGGSGSGGNLNVNGNTGGSGGNNSGGGTQGNGGGSMLGGGGAGNYGGGGNGAQGPLVAGNVGFAGVVVIEEFY